MTTLEVTISDDSKASFILSLLKEFRYVRIGKIQKEAPVTFSLEQNEITLSSKQQKLENAALLLLTDYETDSELTNLTLIDSDDFYEYETK